jgi:hypothetical protein
VEVAWGFAIPPINVTDTERVLYPLKSALVGLLLGLAADAFVSGRQKR